MITPTYFTSRHAHWITPVFMALAFYVFGASMMGSFVIYHTWRFVGEADFVKMHIESGNRIVSFFVLPTLIMTVFLVLQFWHRPRIVPRSLIWSALICTIIPLLSSAFIQIPMQIKLDQGQDNYLLEQLILTDWIRVIPSFGLAIAVFIMIRKCVLAGTQISR
jgi:hypothetical protein